MEVTLRARWTRRVEPCLLALIVLSCQQPGHSAPPAMNAREVTVEGCRLHYLESGFRVEGKSNVLLLHGARFSSRTWEELGTLDTLAAAGHRVIALDLPGFGQSTGEPPANRARFLQSFLEALDVDTVALVTPSMSGGYAIPFLLEHPERVSLFLPVAPVGVPQSLEALSSVDVPTLALWGENDQIVPVEIGRQLVGAMPDARIEVFPDAPHPCYLEATEAFHETILKFLEH